jgi:hypothetical protein
LPRSPGADTIAVALARSSRLRRFSGRLCRCRDGLVPLGQGTLELLDLLLLCCKRIL